MSLLRRTIVLTLSLLVLMSSIGLSVGVHWCDGALQDLAVFHQADDCPMEQKQQKEQMPPCHGKAIAKDTASGQQDMDCCEDDLLVLDELEDALTAKAPATLKSPDLHLLAVLHVSFRFLALQLEEAPKKQYLSYASPPLVRDIPVLVQSFLI